jgi:hypothetical protein
MGSMVLHFDFVLVGGFFFSFLLEEPLTALHASINQGTNKTTNSVALVRDQTVPTEQPPLVGEVTANFC